MSIEMARFQKLGFARDRPSHYSKGENIDTARDRPAPYGSQRDFRCRSRSARACPSCSVKTEEVELPYLRLNTSRLSLYSTTSYSRRSLFKVREPLPANAILTAATAAGKPRMPTAGIPNVVVARGIARPLVPTIIAITAMIAPIAIAQATLPVAFIRKTFFARSNSTIIKSTLFFTARASSFSSEVVTVDLDIVKHLLFRKRDLGSADGTPLNVIALVVARDLVARRFNFHEK